MAAIPFLWGGRRWDGGHPPVCTHLCFLCLQEIGAQKDELSFEQFHLFYKKLMFEQQKSVRGLLAVLVFLGQAQSRESHRKGLAFH